MKKLLFVLVVLCVAIILSGCHTGADTTVISAVTPAAIDEAVTGVELYGQDCYSCHGQNGAGVEGYTQDMADSKRLRDLDDAALIAFMNAAHPATELTEPELLAVFAYLRGIRP